MKYAIYCLIPKKLLGFKRMYVDPNVGINKNVIQ